MNLGENIYKFRTQKNMSQGDLADALDVSRQSVSKWENNNAVPELDKLIRMSEIFGITLDELVSGEKPASKPEVSSANMHRFSRRGFAGILLLGCALLIVLAHILAGEVLAGMFLALPLIGAGFLCFTKVRHLPFWCVWILCLPLVFTPFTSYIRHDISRWISPVLYLFLLAVTLFTLRNDPVPMTRKNVFFLIFGYIAWFVWFADRIIMHFRIQAHNDPGVILFYPHWKNALGFLLFTMILSVMLRLKRKNQEAK